MKLSTDFRETITSFVHEISEKYLYDNSPDFLKMNSEYILYCTDLKNSLTNSNQKRLFTILFESYAKLYHHKLIRASIKAIKYYSKKEYLTALSDSEINEIINFEDNNNNYIYVNLKSAFEIAEQEFLQWLDNEQLHHYKLYKNNCSSFHSYIIRESFKGIVNIISQTEMIYTIS